MKDERDCGLWTPDLRDAQRDTMAAEFPRVRNVSFIDHCSLPTDRSTSYVPANPILKCFM